MARKVHPIGVFDSGIGGLTVVRSIRQALPSERLLYFGDNAHIPYGQRSLEEVRRFSFAIVDALLEHECAAIVVACNTASAAALAALRRAHPEVPFVGMEPAVKPAVEHTRSGVVGVIATPATFQSEVYASVVERFAKEVRVLHQPCPGLVTRIESGDFSTPGTEHMLRGWLEPMLAEGIDALVLGCTHYPIVRPLIEQIVGPTVRVIDPAPAIAKQLGRVLGTGSSDALAHRRGDLVCYTSGDPMTFTHMLDRLELGGAPVHGVAWTPEGRLHLVPDPY